MSAANKNENNDGNYEEDDNAPTIMTNENKKQYLIPLETDCVYYDECFLTSEEEANEIYQDLWKHTKWEKTAKINRWVCLCHELPVKSPAEKQLESQANDGGGPKSDVNVTTNTNTTKADDDNERKDADEDYKYRDAPGESVIGFSKNIETLARKAENWYFSNFQKRVNFNVCLLNFYENGEQRIGWHSDREEIGRNTPIASISLGATRTFLIRSKSDGIHDHAAIQMKSGSMVLMENICQHNYVHSVPKESHVTTGRINLTFRSKTNTSTNNNDNNQDNTNTGTSNTTAGEQEHERRDKWLENLIEGAVPTSTGWSLSPAHTNPTTDTHINNKDTTSVIVFGDGVDRGHISLKNWKIYFLVKTNMGAEGYCAAEINEQFQLIHKNHKQKDNNNNRESADTNSNNISGSTYTDISTQWKIVAQPLGMDGYVAVARRMDESENHNYDIKNNENDDKINDSINANNKGKGVDSLEWFSETKQHLLKLKSAHHVLHYHLHFHLNDVLDSFTTNNSKDENNIQNDIKTNNQTENSATAATSLSPSPSNPEQTSTTKLVDGEALYQYFKQRLVNQSAAIPTLEQLNQIGIDNNNNNNKKKSGGTFRTTCERIGGPHAFRAPEVEREIGGAMSEYYSFCKPKMEGYDVNVRVDVVGDLVIIGTQLNVHDLSKERHFLKFRNVVTIKANLAYAMVRCANIQPGMTIADPFCGSGTLLLEALDVCNKQLNCIGLDVSRRTVDGARDNAIAEGYTDEHTCKFICSDARGLRRHLQDDTIDAIITNLPWGIKTGHNTSISDLQTMYEIFLRTAWYSLKDGARVVVFVLRGLQFTRIVRKLGGRYRLLSVNVIRTSNNLPCIVVIEKLAIDEIREAVKGQLSHLNKYVSVSPELYEAIHMENIDD